MGVPLLDAAVHAVRNTRIAYDPNPFARHSAALACHVSPSAIEHVEQKVVNTRPRFPPEVMPRSRCVSQDRQGI